MSNAVEERHLSAILFTDIVGYTALTELDESRAMELLETHNRQLRPFLDKFHGREVKTIGDAFLVEFDSALKACRCSVGIQKFFHDYNESVTGEWKIRLRIGIHMGEIIRRREDVFGDTVNIASRIEQLADPEGICISGQVFDQINNDIDLPFVRIEDVELKNVKKPVAVYKILLPWEKWLQASHDKSKLNRNRIAILPFAKVSSDTESEFFADGITEELISTISKISQLSVISRTSVMQYKDRNKQVREIGKELKVGSILEGSVRKAGDRVRTSVQLIDVISDSQTWSEIYDKKLEDIFSIQSQIAGNVAQALQLDLLERDKQRIRSEGTKSAEAHSLYLRGRFYSLRVTLKSYTDAIELFQKAIDRDPHYALAIAAIADCYAGLGAWEIAPAKAVLPKARLYAEKALEMDDSIAEAHAALATVLNLQDWKFPEAEAEYRRAIELNPSNAYTHMHFALFLGQFRRSAEAIDEAKRAIELDPLSAETYTIAGVVHLYNGRIGEAKGFLMNALALDASSSFAYDALGCCYVRSGEIEEGISQLKKANDLAGGAVPLHANDLAYAYAKAGRIEETNKILLKQLELQDQGRVSPVVIAGIYANIGEKEKAFEWLFRAIEDHSGYLFSIAVDFAFENLWHDPRWQIVLNKVGFDLGKRSRESVQPPS